MQPDKPFSNDPAAAALAADWVTIWQSEMAALATDREASEQLCAMLGSWFAASTLLQGHERATSDGAATPDAASRSATPASASPARQPDPNFERRVAELDRRLAAMAGPDGVEPPSLA